MGEEWVSGCSGQRAEGRRAEDRRAVVSGQWLVASGWSSDCMGAQPKQSVEAQSAKGKRRKTLLAALVATAWPGRVTVDGWAVLVLVLVLYLLVLVVVGGGGGGAGSSSAGTLYCYKVRA